MQLCNRRIQLLSLTRRLGRCVVALGLGLGLALAATGLLHSLALARSVQPVPAAGVITGTASARLRIYAIQSADFPTVTVDLGVFDEQQRLISTLTLDKLAATLDNTTTLLVPLSLTTRTSSVPVAVALVLDTVAPSTQFSQVLAAAQAGVAHMNPNDVLALVEARNGPPELRLLDSNPLSQALKRVDEKSLVTDMRPAIMRALSFLQQPRYAQMNRAVIVISDQGGDWSGAKTITPVVAQAQDNSAPVPVHVLLYAPGELGELSKILFAGAARTGGITRQVGLNEVQGALLGLLDGLQMQVENRLTFVAKLPEVQAGEPHPLAVMLNGEPSSETTKVFTPERKSLSVTLANLNLPVSNAVTTTLHLRLVPPTSTVYTEGLRVGYEIAGITSTVVTTPFLFTVPFSLLSTDSMYGLRVVMTDGAGNRSAITTTLRVPPTFTLALSSVPTQSNDWVNGPHDFTFTVQVNPPLTHEMRAEVDLGGAWTRVISFVLTGERTVVTVTKPYVLYGANSVQVAVIDAYGQRQVSPDAQLQTFNVPLIGLYVIFQIVVATVLGLVLGWLLWRRWRARSYAHVPLVLRNMGNVPTDYELWPSDATKAFTFTIKHQTYPLAKRANPVLLMVAKPVTSHALAAPRITSPAPPAPPPPEPAATSGAASGGLFSGLGKIGNIASQVTSAIDSASAYVPDEAGRTVREVSGASRQVQAKSEQAQRTGTRVQRLADGTQTRMGQTNGTATKSTARPSNPGSPNPEMTHVTGAVLGVDGMNRVQTGVIQPEPMPLGRTGWWVTPVLAPGATVELDVVVQPKQPFSLEKCDLEIKALPTRTPNDASGNPTSLTELTDEPDTEDNKVTPHVLLRHGLPSRAILWLGLAAIAGLVAVFVLWVLGVLANT